MGQFGSFRTLSNGNGNEILVKGHVMSIVTDIPQFDNTVNREYFVSKTFRVIIFRVK